MKYHIRLMVAICLLSAGAVSADDWTTTTAGQVTIDAKVGVGTHTPTSFLHLAPPGGVGTLTINTSGTQKIRMGSIGPGVPDWAGWTLNARFVDTTGWNLDDTSKDGWFVKLDGRSIYNKFAIWRINPGANPRPENQMVELLSLDAAGTLTAVNIAAKYQDVAEWVPSTGDPGPGTVVIIAQDADNHVLPSTQAYDTRVAGVISAQPGIVLGEASASKSMVATTGRVKVKVDATSAPIRRGDILVSSATPGVAMKSEALDLGGVKIHRPGTVIGKALEDLESGKGEILVLLTLQ